MEIAANATCLDDFRKEDGSLSIFALFLFICMLMFGGIALDIMLYENQRTHIQNSTDRAVLAAANLGQTVDPKVVVQDYLAKVGITISQDDVQVTEVGTFPVITGRQVSISVEPNYQTLLMDMVGVETLPLSLTSEATEGINDIEVSLVLDISGSMGWSNKLTLMQGAANDFVDTVLAGSTDNRVSISLVPYSTQVNAGADLLGTLNVNSDHNYSHCVNFNGSTFNSTSIGAAQVFNQTAHFDPWTGYSGDGSPNYRVCRDEWHAEIQPWTNVAQDLKDQINAMTAAGNTSIDVAVKWGAALLDPSMNEELNVVRGLPGSNIPALFSTRPFAYDREDTLKFIVVMTDGINTSQYRLKDSHKSGDSPIYRDTVTGHYSIDSEENDDHDGDGNWWEDYWYVGSFGDYQYNWIADPFDSDGAATTSEAMRLTWPEVWASKSMSWLAYHMHYRQYWDADDYYNNYLGYNGYNGPLEYTSASSKNSRLDEICTAAKNNDVVIFAVGFEVTDASAAIMRNCASTPNHFYRVDGLDIAYAFASIANQINQLKLTQ